MTQIRTLFERDPDREVIGVVKINDHDPQRVWVEMDEYVATEEVRTYFRDFLDRYLESRRGVSEDVCIWISGFFGSGKSHFLKVLGYLLDNTSLSVPSGSEIPSTEFLCSRLGFPQLAPLLSRELNSKVIYINLLDQDAQAQIRPTISRRIYRELLTYKGLSTQFWVAAWEEELQSLGKWHEFLQWVQACYSRNWPEEQRLNADTILTRALIKFFPDRYPDEAAARRAIDDSKERFQEIHPSEIAQLLCREAKSIDPQKGRLVVLLDEVGLYIGDSIDRLTDLNSLAEQVAARSRGKVWLITTAQEALAELVPRLTADREILGWLQDRFRMRFQLTPANIEKVVAERLLKKKPNGATALAQLFDQAAGALTAAATLQGISTGRLSTHIGKESFVSFYPLLPHYILLLQEAFSTLRQRGVSNEEAKRRLAGRERSMLQTIHAVLRGEGALQPFADSSVGDLITFDLLYDAITTELGIIQSDHHNAITRRVAEVEVDDGLSGMQVAKALFLLQQVGEWLPCSLENIAAILCSSVNIDVHAHRESVKHSLDALIEAGWVIEENNIYRFLSPSEHDFEQEVRANLPTAPEKKQEIIDILKQKFQNFRYEHGSNSRTPLDVKKEVDLQQVSEAGDLSVCLYSPLAGKEKDEVITESLNNTDTVFWLAQDNPEIESILSRALSIKKAWQQWQGRTFSPEQDQYRNKLRGEMEDILGVALPQLLERAFLNGVIIIAGVEYRPESSTLAAALQSALRQVAGNIFTEFIDVRVERDEDCAKILRWRPGASLTSAYYQLDLIGASGVNTSCQAVSLLRSELLRRQQTGLERTGSALVEHFRKKPYGWGHQLVRLIAACLFKNGDISIELVNRELNDVNDPQVKEIFAGLRQFRPVRLKVLPSVDWRRARELLVEFAGSAASNTFEEVSEEVGRLAESWSREAGRLSTRTRDLSMPGELSESCRKVSEALAAVSGRNEPNARLREFLDKEDLLRQHVPTFNKVLQFETQFGRYRRISKFIHEAGGWARSLSDHMKERWQILTDGLNSADLMDRFGDLEAAYQILIRAYQESYMRRHQELSGKVEEAENQLKEHPLMQGDDAASRQLLLSLLELACGEEALREENLRCPQCRKSYFELDPALVESIRLNIERELDRQLVVDGDGAPEERIEPLVLRQTLASTEAVETILQELKNYVRRSISSRFRVRVEVKATPEEE
jgi:hypothetical protein